MNSLIEAIVTKVILSRDCDCDMDVLTSAGSIHDTIEYRGSKDIFRSILGNFEN